MTEGGVWFVSTHLDDVVLSCGHRLSTMAAPRVVTVFTEGPSADRRDGWNFDTTGEASPAGAQAVRRAEDAAALGSLGIEASWLGLHEAEYQSGAQDVAAIAFALAAFLRGVGAAVVVGPLGRRHPDHIAVSDAVLAIVASDAVEGRLYLDQPYAESFPELVAPRIDAVRSGGVDLVELEAVSGDAGAKREAFAHYASQVAAVCDDHVGFERALSAPERWWDVVPVSRSV